VPIERGDEDRIPCSLEEPYRRVGWRAIRSPTRPHHDEPGPASTRSLENALCRVYGMRDDRLENTPTIPSGPFEPDAVPLEL
jgi:hypothetical protein